MSTTRRSNTPKLPHDRTKAGAKPALELVRLSRVAAVQKRIASGYYDRDEVRDRLAQAVLEVIESH